MRKYVGLLYAGLALAVFTPAAPAEAQSGSQSGGQGISEADRRNLLVEMALRDRVNRDAALLYGDFQTEDEEDEEVEKTYRYEGGRGIFQGAEFPERVFNNIDYPY